MDELAEKLEVTSQALLDNLAGAREALKRAADGLAEQS